MEKRIMSETSSDNKPVQKKQGSHRRTEITSEIRQLLKQKRLSLGLSYVDAAQFIGVHWTTFRKWENGETKMFTCAIARRVKHFIESPKPAFEYHVNEDEANQALDRLIHRLRNVYHLCQQQQPIQEKFIKRLETLLDEMLTIYSQSL